MFDQGVDDQVSDDQVRGRPSARIADPEGHPEGAYGG